LKPDDDAQEPAPKSAYELAMERLKQKDRAAGVAEARPLTDELRNKLAELRQVYEAKLAEVEILHRDAMLKARSEDEQELAEEHYRRDRDRLVGERDRKLDELRSTGA